MPCFSKPNFQRLKKLGLSLSINRLCEQQGQQSFLGVRQNEKYFCHFQLGKLVGKKWQTKSVVWQLHFSGAEIILKNYAVFNKNLGMFQCTICNKQTARKDNLFKHLESIHFPNSFTYTCDYCQVIFSTKKKKEYHLAKFHRNRKDYATVH